MLSKRNLQSTDFGDEDSDSVRLRAFEPRCAQGGTMPTSYYVIGAVGLLAILVAIKLTPDFIRYMKMRAM
jgi:hypothetical protein